jgi:plasmid stabilization system protein ParE
MNIKWTTTAKANIRHIQEYIAKDSVQAANDFVKKLLAAPMHLIDFPNSGRMIPELQDPYKREILLGNYRIMYYINRNTIFITQVRHSARLFPD